MIDSRILVGLIAVLITITVVVYMGIGEPDRQEIFKTAFQGRSVETGALVFEQNCSTCHGKRGEGTPLAPQLNSREFFDNRLDELGFQGTMESYLTLTISGGRPAKSDQTWPGNMPTWSVDYGGPLRNDQIKNVVDYIMNWEAEAAPAGPAEVAAPADDTPEGRGRSLFEGSAGCVACHTVNGVGGSVGPNLTNVYADKGEDYIRESIMDPNAVIVEGFQPNIMPQTYSQTLSQQEIDDIIAFLANAGSQVQ